MPQTMMFKTADLLGKLKANRDRHREVFLKAQEGYRVAVVAELDRMLEEAKTGKRIRRIVELVEPVDMTREYDRVIAMLEMTTEDKVELTQTEFANYVLDQWNWTEQVTHSNSRYIR